jgi:DNA gyrase subunit A
MGETTGTKVAGFANALRSNFLTYAKYVIRDRSLPDVRDGLKPVHRRIMWTMWEMGCKHNAKAKKSGRIVGDCMGKYHPHGDMAIYDAMVRMAQPFSMNIPLVNGQGNFGSLDGDNPAAQRYTEARLSQFAQEVLFADIEDETVDFVPNYDGELKEPTVLPARVPLVLMTAPSGIAVAMATNIQPHNLAEVCDAMLAVMDDPKMTLEAVMSILPAPDFPLGGTIKRGPELVEMYQTGHGKYQYRAVADFETEGHHKAIIIRDVPYGQNKADIIKSIAELVRDGKVEGISEVRDESTKDGVRICIELKGRASHEAVLNSLYSHTKFQINFSQNMVVIDGHRPKNMGLLEILHAFIDFRREVIRRRTECRKAKAEARLELVEAMLWAGEHAEEVVETVQHAEDPIAQLIEMGLTTRQAEHVYGMPLRRLSNADQSSLDEERMGLETFIKECVEILTNRKKLDGVIRAETQEIRDKFANPRRTTCISDFSTITAKEMVKEQDVALVFLSDGTVKSTPVSDYRLQKRRGRGVMGVRVPDGVYPIHMETVSTHDDVMVITDKGNRYLMHGYDVPALERGRKPKHVKEYIELFGEDEHVVAVTKAKLADDEVLVILGSEGMLKKQSAETVMSVRETTTLFYPVDKGGEVISAIVAKTTDEIMVTTAQGQVLRTKLSDIREVASRLSKGVRILKLAKGDRLLSVSVAESGGHLLTVTKQGYGKRTPVSEYQAHARGGKGVRGCKLKDDDELIFASVVPEHDEDAGISILTSMSMAIRMRVLDVREMASRTGLGTILKKLESDECLTTVSVE